MQCGELYERPESTECMRELNAIGDKNWQDYCSDQVDDMSSHLMTYPIQVSVTWVPLHDKVWHVGDTVWCMESLQCLKMFCLALR